MKICLIRGIIWLLVVVFMCIQPVFAQDIPVDNNPNTVQNEISLTCIPSSQPGMPNLLFAAYNDNPYTGALQGLGYAYSTNGGAKWTNGNLQFPINNFTGNSMTRAFDPTVTSDSSGNVFVGHIADDINGYSGLYVYKSSNYGVSWSPPVSVSVDNKPQGSPDPNYRFNDRCQITADTSSSSSYHNNIYITWIKDRGLNMPFPWSDIYFSYSNNSGVNFSKPLRINELNNSMSNIPIPAVASNGTIYVVWLDYNVQTGGTARIFIDKSHNGGISWGTDKLVKTILLPPLNVNTANGTSDALAKGGTPIAASPTNPSELYIAYATDPDGLGPDDSDINFIKSTDGGNSWTNALRVNDDTTTNDQILPWMDVKPDGTIDIVWYDRRNDINDTIWDIYIARSVDGGSSFSTNTQVNINISITPVTPSGKWMGEYLGLVVDSQYAYVAFTSTQNHINGDIYFNKIHNSAIPAYSPYTPSNPTPKNMATNVNISTINLVWTGGDPDINDIVTYDVYFGNSSSISKVSNKQSSNSYNPGALNYNTTYNWQIRAWDNHGNSAWGPLWQFTTEIKTTVKQPNNPPNKPSNPSPTIYIDNVSISNLNLSWNGGDVDENDTVSYDVYFGNSSPPAKIVSNQSKTFYIPEGLDYNTTYYWQIIAWDDHGNSTSGDIWYFKTELKGGVQPDDKKYTDNAFENIWIGLLIIVIIILIIFVFIFITRKKK